MSTRTALRRQLPLNRMYYLRARSTIDRSKRACDMRRALFHQHYGFANPFFAALSSWYGAYTRFTTAKTCRRRFWHKPHAHGLQTRCKVNSRSLCRVACGRMDTCLHFVATSLPCVDWRPLLSKRIQPFPPVAARQALRTARGQTGAVLRATSDRAPRWQEAIMTCGSPMRCPMLPFSVSHHHHTSGSCSSLPPARSTPPPAAGPCQCPPACRCSPPAWPCAATAARPWRPPGPAPKPCAHIHTSPRMPAVSVCMGVCALPAGAGTPCTARRARGPWPVARTAAPVPIMSTTTRACRK